MHRKIVYTGAVTENTDILDQEIWTMEALGYMIQFMVGLQTSVVGFVPTLSSSALSVTFSSGAIVQAEPVDNTELGTDTLTPNSNVIMKIGHSDNAAPSVFPLTAPTTTGQSINYLVQVSFEEEDDTPVALEYFNSANPEVPIVNAPQNTRRAQIANLNLIQGAAANTGTQVVPAPDSGYVGLYVITVPYGATVGTSCTISTYPGAPFLPNNFTNLRTRLTANLNLYVANTGNDGNVGTSPNSPFLTIQKAWNTIISNYDLNGFTVTVNIANGTYTTPVYCIGVPTGAIGGIPNNPSEPNIPVSFVGNVATPDDVVINIGSGCCFFVGNGANISVKGMKLLAGGTSSDYNQNGVALYAFTGGGIVFGNIDFGACSFSHIACTTSSIIESSGNSYTISGSAPSHVQVYDNAYSTTSQSLATFGSGVTFSTAFAVVYACSVYACDGMTFSGSFTGTRYLVSTNGVINTGGSGNVNFFPGSVAGSTATGGQYT